MRNDECRMWNDESHASRITFYVSRFTLAALLAILAPGASSASAQGSILIENRGVTMEFPERLTFEARIESDAEIDQVVLEYGVEKLTCGAVTAKAFPDFEPGKAVDVSWTWEMLQSGAESPIDMYVYADTADMREAILYEPGWTGGQARPEHDILLIGISPDSPGQVAWGRRGGGAG